MRIKEEISLGRFLLTKGTGGRREWEPWLPGYRLDNNISPGVPGEQVVGQVAGGSGSHGYLDTG
jgi:hypothetical protein